MPQIESFDDSHAITLGGVATGAGQRLLRRGDVIGGSYRLKSLLGHGGMGYVFCAEHTMIKCDYALKILAPEQLNESSRQRFETEGKAIAALDHANIVKVYNMGLDQGECPFYVMDLLTGQALSDYIAERGGIDFEEGLDIFCQLASGLGYAHGKGIVHRDVKPSNIILLTGSRGQKLVKLVDFGIAKLLPSSKLNRQALTSTGEVFGSPFYMSPEQSLGTTVDHRSDIYSLGCTLFESLSGRPPFRGPNSMATAMMHQNEPIPSLLQAFPEKGWPPSVDLLLAKMMAKRVEDRYQSMEQLSHDLERMLQGKPIGKVPRTASQSFEPLHDGTAGRAFGAGRDMPGGQSQSSAAFKKSTGLRAIVIFSSVLGLLFIGGGLWFLQRQQEQKQGAASRPPHQELPTQNFEKAKHIFDRVESIESVKLVKNGLMVRHFTFPEWSIGEVSAPGQPPLEACGPQDLPADQPLILEIGKNSSLEVLNNPEIVVKIGKDEFASLLIDGAEKGEKAATGIFSSLQSGSVLDILKAASTWTRLTFIQLRFITAEKRILDQMNQCRKLTSLVIEDCTFDSTILANQPYIGHLQFLSLANGQDMQPICHALSSSSVLTSVRFWHCILSPNVLRELHSCPQLYLVDLSQPNYSELVRVVPQLTSVKKVRFREVTLRPDQIKLITGCPHIALLYLDKNRYSREEIVRCRRYEPKVRFETY